MSGSSADGSRSNQMRAEPTRWMVRGQTVGMGAADGPTDPAPEVRVGGQQEQEWPGSSSLATDCVLNLVRLADRMLGYGLAITAGHGVRSVGAFNVLTILHGADGPLLPSTIAARMIVTRG